MPTHEPMNGKTVAFGIGVCAVLAILLIVFWAKGPGPFFPDTSPEVKTQFYIGNTLCAVVQAKEEHIVCP